MLSGSKQLEYTSDPFHYRAVYFGSTRFSGQEVVYRVGCPVWSMVYFNEVHGSVEEFWGSEWIEKAGVRIYHLRYSGGTLCCNFGLQMPDR